MQDTVFDQLKFVPSQYLHHDVYTTGYNASQKSNKATDHPATDLQTAETLMTSEESREMS